MKSTSSIWIARGVSSTRGGATHRFTPSLWACLRMRARSIGRPFNCCLLAFEKINMRLVLLLTYDPHRFRDIGYQHIPYFNCPNSPKCRGCVKGRFTDGEKWLFKEDCRPNWFKFVGTG